MLAGAGRPFKQPGSGAPEKRYKLAPGTPADSPRGSRCEARESQMKILYFDDFKLGVLKGDNTVVDVSAVVQDIPHVGPRDLINGLIERFASYRGKLEQAAVAGPGRPARQRAHPPAIAEADHHRLHGGQLHGGRHAH